MHLRSSAMRGRKRGAPNDDEDVGAHVPEATCNTARGYATLTPDSKLDRSLTRKKHKIKGAVSSAVLGNFLDTVSNDPRPLTPGKKSEKDDKTNDPDSTKRPCKSASLLLDTNLGSYWPSQSPYSNDIYTVGWICAISTEYVAAQEFLDEEHGIPQSARVHDNNCYTLGRIGEHNVVITVLPAGEYGSVAAAAVASDMLHSFSNVSIGLMVGIAGGAPSQDHDIRLGDVVVGAAGSGKGGILLSNFGKRIQGRGFEEAMLLRQPPKLLQDGVNALEANIERTGYRLDQAVSEVISRNPRLQKRYQRPEPSTDRLFTSDITHDSACTASCSNDPSLLIPRAERIEGDDNLAVHYGLIYSGNQLIKDATFRGRFAKEQNVLCFEMEAAGLMIHFPCLVIRGICDYADTHKHKEWQGYAAMVAAAYARSLLYQINPCE